MDIIRSVQALWPEHAAYIRNKCRDIKKGYRYIVVVEWCHLISPTDLITYAFRNTDYAVVPLKQCGIQLWLFDNEKDGQMFLEALSYKRAHRRENATLK